MHDERAHGPAEPESGGGPRRGRFVLGDRPWYKNATAVLGLVAALIGATLGIRQLVGVFGSNPRPLPQNTEVVLDASTSMADPLAGGGQATKFTAAKAAVAREFVRLAGDNLALRRFGGECSDPSDLLVDFGQDNGARIRSALDDVSPEGDSSLAGAVIDATGDFGDLERFPNRADVSKRIVVVTGGVDTCERDPVATIRRRLGALAGPIALDFRFIGLGIASDQQDELQRVAEATGGTVAYADTEGQLQDALRHVLELEPVADDVEAITGSVNDVIDQLNAFAAALNSRDYAAAEARRIAAAVAFSRTALRFQHLATLEQRKEYRRLQEAARKARSAQQALLAQSERILALVRTPGGDVTGSEAYATAIQAWNDLIKRYNDQISGLNTIMGELTG